MICEPGDVVVVPFPFVEGPGTKRRPALVLSQRTFNSEAGASLLAMITTKTHSPWPGDVAISDLEAAGLERPCIVRLKIFTLDNRLLSRKAGRISPRDHKEVSTHLGRHLSIQS